MDEHDQKFLEDFKRGRVDAYVVFNLFPEENVRTPAVIKTAESELAILLFAQPAEAAAFAEKRALPSHEIVRVDIEQMNEELAILCRNSQVPVTGFATVKKTGA